MFDTSNYKAAGKCGKVTEQKKEVCGSQLFNPRKRIYTLKCTISKNKTFSKK